MPFKISTEKLDKLKNRLVQVVKDFKPFEIVMDNYGAFPPKVIFIQILPSEELNKLHSLIKRIMRNEFFFLNQDYKDKGFHPHITVAFRDLRKPQFNLAWKRFMGEKFAGHFLCRSICIFQHTGENWIVHSEIPMAS